MFREPYRGKQVPIGKGQGVHSGGVTPDPGSCPALLALFFLLLEETGGEDDEDGDDGAPGA